MSIHTRYKKIPRNVKYIYAKDESSITQKISYGYVMVNGSWRRFYGKAGEHGNLTLKYKTTVALSVPFVVGLSSKEYIRSGVIDYIKNGYHIPITIPSILSIPIDDINFGNIPNTNIKCIIPTIQFGKYPKDVDVTEFVIVKLLSEENGIAKLQFDLSNSYPDYNSVPENGRSLIKDLVII